jgi:hypothetical protein
LNELNRAFSNRYRIRTFFIKTHIDHSLHISENKIWKWFVTQAKGVFTFRRKADSAHPSLNAIWDERKDDIEQLESWLMESSETFIVVQGPRGSGKRPLVLDQALKGRKNILIIDCKPVQEAGTDAKTISAAAEQVGYRPVFSWMNSVSSLVDLAVQGTTGVKTGFSETLEAQLEKICVNSTSALRAVGLEGRKKTDKDFDLGDDEYLEAHPERRPVVVFDNFLHKANEKSIVYDKVALWAAALVSSNTAHVIFLTNDVSFSKSLGKALPDRIFHTISLGDCSPPVAKRYVINHLDADSEEVAEGEKQLTPSQRRRDLGELDEVIDILGGRLTDLEYLARRMKTGETPKKAVHEIISQTASEILKLFVFDGEGSDKKWSPSQAWTLIKKLATSDTVRYNELLLLDIFKSGEATLVALEAAELITIVSQNGRPAAVKASRPVFGASFRLLLEDPVLAAKMDLAVANELIKVEGSNIDKWETELSLLGSLPSQPREIATRVHYLLVKIQDAQTRIDGYEKEAGLFKKILKSEY